MPFTQVKQLKYSANHPFTVSFKTKHADGFTTVFLGAQSLRKEKSTPYPKNAPKLFRPKKIICFQKKRKKILKK